MSLSFSDYLDAKFPLDERSLNPDVRAVFQAALCSRVSAQLLDLGCGLGASLRRLLAAGLLGNLDITAVDQDAGLLAKARARAEHELGMAEFEVDPASEPLSAQRNRQTLTLALAEADVMTFAPDAPGTYDAVIAHALMDLLPAPQMAARIHDWLGPAGLFYASLNYDGGTTLFPLFPDAAFEAELLAHYDRSMIRHPHGHVSNGAHAGRQLHAALLEAGFEVLAYGSSDWNITPFCGAYRDADDLCLRALLEMMHGEAQRSGDFDPAALAHWLAYRQAQIDTRELGLIIHQLDLLAQKPA